MSNDSIDEMKRTADKFAAEAAKRLELLTSEVTRRAEAVFDEPAKLRRDLDELKKQIEDLRSRVENLESKST